MGTSPAFPERPHNRPALPRIGYRIGTYSDFREHLMQRLDRTDELANWTHREPDDPGIALLECGAVLGDILTFYQELYANEAFHRTALWRSSVAELVRLVGYRLAPGLGGRGTFAFELRPGAPVTVPAGFSLQAELEGAAAPATFETTAELVAHPELSRFHLHRPLVEPELQAGARALWIRSPEPLELAAGDRLLLAAPDAADPDRLEDTQIVVVEEVSLLHDATIVTIEGALQRDYAAGAVGFRLGRSFRHFGHSAPPQEVTVGSGGTAVANSVNYCRSLSGLTTLGTGPLGARDLPLDEAVDDFAAGRAVICSYVGCLAAVNPGFLWGGEVFFSGGGAPLATMPSLGYTAVGTFLGPGALSDLVPPSRDTLVRSVESVSSTSLRLGSLTGPSTVLRLDRMLEGSGADMRTFEIHEVTSPRLEVSAQPRSRGLSSGNELYFHGNAAAAAALEGRRILLAEPGEEPVIAVATAVETDNSGISGFEGLHRLTLAAEVRYAGFPQVPTEASTVVFGNLVDADQGKSELEAVLGSGDARAAFQTFKLPIAPLTYHHQPTQSPPQAPGLGLTVAGRTWTRVDSLFGQSPNAEVYIVREDAEGRSWVQFGDGLAFGARLPSGVDNVRVRPRTGSGAHGPLKEGAKVQAGRLDRLQAVQLPGVVAGGAEPETADVARAAAPGRVQSLGRLVALSDFEAEALAIPGVALATAVWGLAHGVPTATVTVLLESGREAEHAAVAESLRTAARERGPDRFEIDVLQGRFHDVRLRAEVAVAAGLDSAAVLEAVGAALGVEPARDGLFSLRRRRFGQPEHAERAAGVIQQVPGVSWARVTRFRAVGALSLGSGQGRTVACPADGVLRLAPDGLALTAVAGGTG